MVRRNIRDRNILFLCHDNACLSLIAEAIAKQLLPPKTQIFSAGLKPERIDPKTIEVMREIGMDIARHRPKGLSEIPADDVDLIVWLGEAQETHAVFSSRAIERTWSVADPRQEPGSNLQSFRSVRDEIDKRVAALFLDYWRNI